MTNISLKSYQTNDIAPIRSRVPEWTKDRPLLSQTRNDSSNTFKFDKRGNAYSENVFKMLNSIEFKLFND